MPDSWPEALPRCFTFDSLDEGLGDGRIRSDNDAGPAKVRRRSSAAPAPLSGEMIMTPAQWAALRTFITVTTIGGSLPFLFPAQDASGSQLLVRFAENLPRRSRHAAGKLRVSIALEVLP